VTVGTFRACLACAAARARCSGGSPCGRCGIRSIECVYPNKRRKGAREANEYSFDTNEFQISNNSGSTVAQLPSTTAAGPANVQAAVAPSSTQSARSHETQGFVGNVYSVQDNSASNMPTAQQESAALDRPGHLHEQQQYSDTPATRGWHAQRQEPAHSSMPLSNHGYAHPDMQSRPDPELDPASLQYGYPAAWDDSLNWIPISVYPSPYDGELEHDFSFLLPPLSESSNIDFDYAQSMPVNNTSHLYQLPSATSTHGESLPDNRKLSVAFTGLAQSPTSSASNELSGRSAVESTLPTARKKRRKSSSAVDTFLQPRMSRNRSSFPLHISSSSEQPDFHPKEYCSPATFDNIVNAFRRLCLESRQHQPFETSSFPDINSLNRYIDLYFEHFHSNFPLIHRPSLGSESKWLILLAVATVGSNFVQASYSLELRKAFQDFLRRAVSECIEQSVEGTADVAVGQARILNLVSLSQAEDDSLRALTARYHAELSHWCLDSGILQRSAQEFPTANHSNSTQILQTWQSWIWTESLNRIGLLTWLLDTSLAYTANIRPMCNMDDARIPLPCADDLWGCQSADEWHLQLPEHAQMPSLCMALEHLYNKKAVYPGLSDISQILLVNALFQRTWEVGTHIKQPLSEWVPTGKARGFLNTPTKDDFWLPLYPLYANWRNSGCDCLDVINWQAASVVAKASGKEHSLMLHLHLARIILLTPFQEIQDLLFSLIGRVGDSSKASFYVHDGSYQPRNKAKLPQIRKITWRWLREDQHKARLAMVHAGSVFWHVRRYSSNSFYEPVAVYLASLVLWTYGSYKSAALERNAANGNAKPVGGPSGPDADLTAVQPSRVERKIRVQDVLQSQEPTEHDRRGRPDEVDHGSDSTSESGSDSAQIDLIYLDRPCDDEMIQQFVRNGHNMTAHISNIGDICQTPRKVLLEGAKLLRSRLSSWGVSREYYDILTRLAEMRKG
jgi:hypothetical protein